MTRAISSSAARNGCGIDGDGAVHEAVEALVVRDARTPGCCPGPAAALRHVARILAAMTPDPVPDPLLPIALDGGSAPAPDPAAEPEGYLVTADDGTRIHFHDWGGPAAHGAAGDLPGVVLVPGLLQAAWSWAPVARRLAGERRVVVVDLRGHGLSDAPAAGYDLASLAADVVLAAEGSGALDARAGRARGDRVRGDRRGGGRRTAGGAVRGSRPGGRGLGARRGDDRRRRRRVPARPRRAAGGPAHDGRVAGGPARLRPRELGCGPGACGARRGGGDLGGAPAAGGPAPRGGRGGPLDVRSTTRRRRCRPWRRR